jgi:hypothetical protein
VQANTQAYDGSIPQKHSKLSHRRQTEPECAGPLAPALILAVPLTSVNLDSDALPRADV